MSTIPFIVRGEPLPTEPVRESTNKEITTTMERVENILKTDQRSRNDDKWLIYKVVREITKIYIPFEDFTKIPSFETITRARRFIQKEDKTLWPTDPKVKERRGLRESEFRQYYGNKN